MAESIIDGRGNAYPVGVTSGNRMMVDLGGDITISGVSIDSVVIKETNPTDSNKNNEAYQFDYSGTGVIGSIHQFIDSAEFVQVIAYSGALDLVTNIGSWVPV